MKYCSLDLELSGFDPLKDEILEIGLAFFEPTPEGLHVTDKWSQVFRPKELVHPKILGLTGLTQEELQKAPLLSDLHDSIQEKLDGAVIIGHNTVLDARFLEAFGFHISGQFIDTLDLVQFLLPTRHSYNLENLTHYFSVPHKEAHRALGDSLATVTLLEHLIKQYKGFTEALRDQVHQLAARHNFLWLSLFDFPFVFPSAAQPIPESSPLPDKGPFPVIRSGSLILQSFDDTTPETTARALAADSSKSFLLIVADKLSVLDLWQQGLGHGMFKPQDRFNPDKFDQLLKQADLTAEQTMFCLKVLVWLHTNWQTETIIDLNLSFFGGQFKSLINNRPLSIEPIAGLVCCDYETFILLSEQQLLTERTPVLWNAHQLEQWLREGSQGKLTWSQVLYLLRTIYNPETDFGRQDLRELVVGALAAADLYFALVNLMISRYFSGQQYVTYEQLRSNEFVFNKIQSAALNFNAKVEAVCRKESFDDLEHFTVSLSGFFAIAPERIKWIEATETNCVFADRPLHVAPILQKVLQPYPAPAVIENIPDKQLLNYLLQRLGLAASITLEDTDSGALIQPIECVVINETLTEEIIVSLLQPSVLPAAVLFPGKAEVRAFYDHNYVNLKQFSNVLAQSYSGGSNKILRNFSIHAASILLVTPPFVIKSQRSLPARTLIVNGLPTVNVDHPYMKALLDYWRQFFPNFVDMQVLSKLYLLFQVFYSEQLERIYISMPNNGFIMEDLPILTVKKL